ncbi:NACHT domain-containing protein [Streptomyces albogriseolus]|uniref:NACHT domain-containing protein n=1 Tax=Streptomyces albogriseolus TaxID=1887 RepID=UPI00368547A5
MEPVVLGGRLASGLIAPLLRKLFVADGPGAGLVGKPVRLSDLVSFRGEKRTLGEKEVHRLAGRLVGQALDSPGEPPFPPDEHPAVAAALARRLLALGELDMDDVQAVRLGHTELAQHLRTASPSTDGLSADACYFLDSATEWACLHILEFFTRRSGFVARTLVEQTRAQGELISRVDELITRTPRPAARDTAFESRYRAYAAKKHGRLTIYGIDLSNSPARWPLDVAYLSLQTLERGHAEPAPGLGHAAPVSALADQVLAGHDRVLLRGVAGSGKTTLIQWLAVSAAQRPTGRMAYLAGRVPFVLPLRTLTRYGERLPTPGRLLSAVDCPLAGAQPEGWEHRVLAAGRGLLLVDGLDEVPEPERARARRWLRDLVNAYPGNRWLVTSRPSAVGEEWLVDDEFTELSLTAMSASDVASFIRRWHLAAVTGEEDEDALLAGYEKQLLNAVRTKPDLGRLATNPLMCGLICALHRDRRGYLPHGRKELYESALSMLLVRRDRERDMAGVGEVSEEPQLQLLQRLAYWLIRNGRTEMDRARAESIIAEFLPAVPAAAVLGDAAAVLRHFLIRTGLLLSPSEDTVHFVHRTFQDYLGARAAVESGDFGLLAEHALDDQWSDVIRMAVAQGRPRERAELLTLVTALPDKRAHLLAMASLEHATELAPEVRRRTEELAHALLPPRNGEEAGELAEAGPLVLELLPGPEGLGDEEAEAVAATAALVGTDAALPVLARFVGHHETRVRITLMRAWDRFDQDTYADEILAPMDTGDFFVSVTSPEALRALPRLGPRPRLTVNGPHEPADIARVLPEGLRSIGLADNAPLKDLRPLTRFGSIKQVGLMQCPAAGDLSPLADLSLSELDLYHTGLITGLHRLTTLTRLAVTSGLPDGLRELPRAAPLTELTLDVGVLMAGGLRGLRNWSLLSAVTLSAGTERLRAEDWAELAALPALTRLTLPVSAAAHCADAGELPGVEVLQVTGVLGAEDLAPLARLCPNLSTVRLLTPRAVRLDTTVFEADFPGTEIQAPYHRPFAL